MDVLLEWDSGGEIFRAEGREPACPHSELQFIWSRLGWVSTSSQKGTLWVADSFKVHIIQYAWPGVSYSFSNRSLVDTPKRGRLGRSTIAHTPINIVEAIGKVHGE